MPLAEFLRWKEVDRIEPFIDRRIDILFGLMTSVLWSALVGKSSKAVDFIPDWHQVKAEEFQSAESIHAMFEAFAMAHNSTIGMDGLN